jgi:hypothetical protein
MFEGEGLIYSYTRKQALEDDVLVDATDTAREAGFGIPVALTAGVWAAMNAIPPDKQGIEDWQGRLWDLLYMAYVTDYRFRYDSERVYKLIIPVGRKKL